MGLFINMPDQSQMDLAQWLHDMYEEKCDSNREICNCGFTQAQWWLSQAAELTNFLKAQGMIRGTG